MGRFKVLIVTCIIAIVLVVGKMYFFNDNEFNSNVVDEQVLSDTDTDADTEGVTMEVEKQNIINSNVDDEVNPKLHEEKVDNPNIDKAKINDEKEFKKQKEKNTTIVKNEVPKSENKEEKTKEVTNNTITYRSDNLGISFDLPKSWENKYSIKDNGEEVVVYMKRDINLTTGDGCLFIISSDTNSYNNGEFLDSVIGVDKITTIRGKSYLVGPPTDCRVELGDPDEGLYKTMTKQVSQVLKTLR